MPNRVRHVELGEADLHIYINLHNRFNRIGTGMGSDIEGNDHA